MGVDFSRPEYMDADREAVGRRQGMAKEQKMVGGEESINCHLKDGWTVVPGTVAAAQHSHGAKVFAVVEREKQ